MIPENMAKSRCLELRHDRDIAISENRKVYRVLNGQGREIGVLKVDGCFIVKDDVARCDYLVILPHFNRAILVELKGKNVEHAVKQIEATLEQLRPELASFERVDGRIVSRNFPNIRNLPCYVSLSKKLKQRQGTLEHKNEEFRENVD